MRAAGSWARNKGAPCLSPSRARVRTALFILQLLLRRAAPCRAATRRLRDCDQRMTARPALHHTPHRPPAPHAHSTGPISKPHEPALRPPSAAGTFLALHRRGATDIVLLDVRTGAPIKTTPAGAPDSVAAIAAGAAVHGLRWAPSRQRNRLALLLALPPAGGGGGGGGSTTELVLIDIVDDSAAHRRGTLASEGVDGVMAFSGGAADGGTAGGGGAQRDSAVTALPGAGAGGRPPFAVVSARLRLSGETSMGTGARPVPSRPAFARSHEPSHVLLFKICPDSAVAAAIAPARLPLTAGSAAPRARAACARASSPAVPLPRVPAPDWPAPPPLFPARAETGAEALIHWDDAGDNVAVFVSLPLAAPKPGVLLGSVAAAGGEQPPPQRKAEDVMKAFTANLASSALVGGGGGSGAPAPPRGNQVAASEFGLANYDGFDDDVGELDMGASGGHGAVARRRPLETLVRTILGLPQSETDELSDAMAAGAPPPLKNDAHRTHAIHVISAPASASSHEGDGGGARHLCTARARADPHRPTAVSLRVPLRRALAGTAAADFEWGHRAFSRGDAASALTPVLAALGAGRVNACAHSRDGRLIAAGGNGVLLIVDSQTREAILKASTPGWVMGVEWSADDRLLAVGGHDKAVRIYGTFAPPLCSRLRRWLCCSAAAWRRGRVLSGCANWRAALPAFGVLSFPTQPVRPPARATRHPPSIRHAYARTFTPHANSFPCPPHPTHTQQTHNNQPTYNKHKHKTCRRQLWRAAPPGGRGARLLAHSPRLLRVGRAPRRRQPRRRRPLVRRLAAAARETRRRRCTASL